MVWLRDGKIIEDIFICFDRILERDRHPDRRTDGRAQHDGIGRACIESRGKKNRSTSHNFIRHQRQQQ